MRTATDLARSSKRYLAIALGDEWEVRLDDEPGTTHFPFCHLRRTSIPRRLSRTGHVTLSKDTLNLSVNAYAGPKGNAEIAREAAYEVEEMLHQILIEGKGTIPVPSGVTAVAHSSGHMTAGTYSYRVSARSWRGQTTALAGVSATVSGGGTVLVSWDPLASARGFLVYRGAAGSERLIAILGQGETQWLDEGLASAGTASVPTVNRATLGAPLLMPLWDYDGVGLDSAVPDLTRLQPQVFARVEDFTTSQVDEPNDSRNIAVIGNLRLSWIRQSPALVSEREIVGSGKIAPS